MTYKGNILHKYYILLHTNVIILHKLPLRLRLILDKYSVWVPSRPAHTCRTQKTTALFGVGVTFWRSLLNFLPFCRAHPALPCPFIAWGGVYVLRNPLWQIIHTLKIGTINISMGNAPLGGVLETLATIGFKNKFGILKY